MIKLNSKIIELKNTHHSQLNLTAQVQLGEKSQCNRGRRTWSAQAPDEHDQCKLQVSLASASSRWAWPAQSKAPVGHGASSRRAWSKLQEGMEQAPGGHGASSRRGADSRRLQSSTEEKKWRRSTYTMPRRYHCGMAGQCPCGHDGTKPGEVADVTSTKHPAHQAQISPRTGPCSSRSSSRLPWPRS
jgi:hypothetical protein